MRKSYLKVISLCFFTVLLSLSNAYIDISLQIVTSSSDIAFNVPMTINSQKYHVAISLENKQEFIVSPNALKHKQKSKKQTSKSLQADMHVYSLEGYTLQGWRRFFFYVFLFVDPQYSHNLHFNISDIKQLNRTVPLTNGLMTLGPKKSENHFFNYIKDQTKDYFKDNIVSLYTAPGSKELKMQLGGYEQQNARGYRNGVRFYEKPIEVSADGNRWLLPVGKLTIAKEKGKKWDCYVIPWSAMKPKLSVQSQFVVLPQTLKEDLETSFESQKIDCSFSATSSQLQCSNISSIDQVLTFLSFSLDDSITMNISLYDLRDQYNSKEKVTSFFVKLGNGDQIQLGSAFLKGYYVSLNMDKPSILFSPINRFTPEITTVSILRFLIMFLLFMLAACICVIIWQQFNNPDRTRRLRSDKNGVRLVSYQRPNEFDDGQ